jgi:hypothetical protein
VCSFNSKKYLDGILNILGEPVVHEKIRKKCERIRNKLIYNEENNVNGEKWFYHFWEKI